MKVKAKRDIKHQGIERKAGEVFDAPEHEAKDLIRQGHAEEHNAEDEETGQSSTPKR